MIDQYNPESQAEWAAAFPGHAAAREAGIIWAREILTTDFVILDTETTGLDHDEAVSIGVIARDGRVLLNTLLCHEKPCNPLALAVHGVTWEATRSAPHFREVWPQLVEATRGKVAIGYNASFDARIIGQMMRRHGMEFQPAFDGYAGDVMQKFAEFYGQWSDYHQSYTWKKLTFAAAYFGITIAGAHGAVADCLLTLRVVEKMAEAKP